VEKIFKEMENAVIEGDSEECIKLAQKSIEMGINPAMSLEKGYGKGMEILGDMFECKDIFLPELMFAEEALNEAIEILKPEIEKAGSKNADKGKIVIGTIQGDVHDIGKNIVSLFLNVSGFNVIDLGRDVSVKNFIDTAGKEDADIIAASALMTTTMIYMPELIKQLNERGLRNKFKVMVGGAPVIDTWANEIGADGYGLTAKQAIEIASELVS